MITAFISVALVTLSLLLGLGIGLSIGTLTVKQLIKAAGGSGRMIHVLGENYYVMTERDFADVERLARKLTNELERK